MKKLFAVVLVLAFAAVLFAGNGNGNDKEKSNNGNHYGQIKHEPTAVPTLIPTPTPDSGHTEGSGTVVEIIE